MISHNKSEELSKGDEYEDDEDLRMTAKGKASDYRTTYKSSSRYKDDRMGRSVRGGGSIRGSGRSGGSTSGSSYNHTDYGRKSSRSTHGSTTDSYHPKRETVERDDWPRGRSSTNSSTKVYVSSTEYSGRSAVININEDCRISRVLRKLSREDDPAKFLPTVKILQDLILLPDNAAYVRQTHILLSNSMAEIINSAPDSCRQEVSIALGRLAHVVGPELPSFINWLFDTIRKETDVKSKACLIKSLIETVEMEKKTAVLGVVMKMFMSEFKVLLESTDIPELLIAAVEALLPMIAIHPESFENYFRDTVDILVGWGLSENQSLPLNDFAVRSLNKLDRFWVNDIPFAESLLCQFLEDIERYVEDLQAALMVGGDLLKATPPETSVTLMIAMLKIFNVVAKCVAHVDINLPEVSNLLPLVNRAVSLCPDELLIRTANVSVAILIPQLLLNVPSSILSILEYVTTLSNVLIDVNETTVVSILQLVTKIVAEVGSQLPLEFVSSLLGVGCFFPSFKTSTSKRVRNSLQALYQAFMTQPNYLQDLIWIIREDIRQSITVLISPEEPEPGLLAAAEALLCFYLAPISRVIVQLGSFTQPIFEFLTDCRPDSVLLSQRAPLMHHALISVLYAYSFKYQHFVPALAKPESNFNFSAVIHLITLLLGHVQFTDNVKILLRWSQEILTECQPFLSYLVESPDFLSFIMALIKRGKFLYDSEVVLSVAVCLKLLGEFLRMIPDRNALDSLTELCCYQTNSADEEISKTYCQLLTDIPLLHTLQLVSENVTLKKLQNRLLHSHITKGNHGFLNERCFSIFMEYLLNGVVPEDESWLKYIFLESYPLGSHSENPLNMLLKHSAMSNVAILLPWICWESAQLCVLNKLRTSLGKAPETFTTIEAGIKLAAKATKINLSAYSRFHNLMDFMEFLEKAMYNASEGSAVALAAPPKNVRTFFHANRTTCTSWLTRVRLLLMSSGIRVSRAAAAVRHGHCFLSELVSSKSTASPEFELGVLYLSWTLLQLKESEAITGLYVWCKKEVDRTFSWLLPVADHAASRYELASEGYKSTLVLNESSSEPKSAIHNTLIRFVYEALLDCLHKTDDFDELINWLQRSHPGLDTSINGMHREKFFDNCYNAEEIHFKKAVHEIFTNSSCQCQWRNKDSNLLPIQALDKSIVELKIANTNTVDDRCKEALNHLADWSKVHFENVTKDSDTDDFGEEIKNTVMKLCVLQNIGKSLESDSLVLQMSENKIEIDLSVQKLLEKWGVNYDFAISNLLKTIKTNYLSAKSDIPAQIGKLLHCINYLIRENLRGGRIDEIDTMLLLSCACEDLLDDGSRIAFVKPKREQPLSSRWLLDLSFFKSLAGQSDVKLNILKSARKESNLRLAKRSLTWHFKCVSSSSDVDLVDISDDLMESFDKRLLSAREGEICVEVAKLLHCSGLQDSAIDFGSLTALKLIRPDNDEVVRRAGSRMLLTLSKWLQKSVNANQQTIPASVSNLVQIPDAVLDDLLIMPHNYVNEHKVIPDYDMAVGRILAMSVAHCPNLAKTWDQYASWCYRWGRKIVDVASKVEISLSEEDLVNIKRMLPSDISENDLSEIVRILGRSRAVSDEDNIEAEHLTTSESVRNHLLSVLSLMTASEETLNKLIDIWRDAQTRIYSAFNKAAQAYFKYLHLCTDQQSDEGKTLTTTLRLLRLLVKHSVELQDVLEEELPCTPTRPWQLIIPQLFSRLNHPENYVRRALSDLLCRMAATPHAQHLITFPAVVGAASRGCVGAMRDKDAKGLLGTCLSQNSEEEGIEGGEVVENEDDDDDESVVTEGHSSALANCFQAMVDTLFKKSPEAITQVQTFVSELRRITVLWDELWLGTLNQHHNEINRRISQLELEIKKVDNNPSLTVEEKQALVIEKHRIIMKPVVFILEQLLAITSATAETPHEKWFQEKLGEAISAALDKLKNPIDPRDPNASWMSFRAIHAKLQKRAQKRSYTVLKMESISPVLYTMKDTAITMPGIGRQFSGNTTIGSISNTIVVLPTKTKPKKLVFTSNTGIPYTYLFKGLEDLHLDERIMQFLTIANTMMSDKNKSNEYRARHYSVTPLGPRSGLISWVDKVTPLFTLYKKWQQRDAMSKQTVANSGYASVRPSELFYSKLTPLLKEAGVPLEHRKEWPLPLLKQVLLELMTETPRDLLAKELWCKSVGPEEWWMTTKRYTRSVAVMSVIGYIIGLGDRHLDNVLIDLQSGEMVHIDYNVCFEKGKSLRVPEKVPFRLTQNIRAALGISDIEGLFRLACEHVLKVLKKGRETLLPLLEAFVYDPLIDWTPGNETGYTGAIYGGCEALKETRQNKRALEREVTKAMFVVRITEIKAEWLENRELVLQLIPQLIADLKNYLSATKLVFKAEDNLADAHQQMLLVKEAEAQGIKHPLFNLATRCALLLKARHSRNNLQEILKEKRSECEKIITNYQATMNLMIKSLPEWVTYLDEPKTPDSYQTFDLVKEFLQTAGQSSMILQCDQSERDIGQHDDAQRQLIRSCIDLLGEYNALVALYPNSVKSHRAKRYIDWADQLIKSKMDLNTCNKVIDEFLNVYERKPVAISVFGRQVVAYAHALQLAINEAEVKLKKNYERLACERKVDDLLEAAITKAREFSMSDSRAAVAFKIALVTSLCTINQRYLQMELTAKGAEEGLEGLRLKEGHTWLEEMHLVSGVVCQFADFFSVRGSQFEVDDQALTCALNCIKKTRYIFRELLDLSSNFNLIILPEALKRMQTNDPNVIEVMHALDRVIESCELPPEELLRHLKLHLRAVIMDTESPYGESQNIVKHLKNGLEELLQRPCDDQSPGQMLLMGLNGLFDKLLSEGKQMATLLTELPLPETWHKLDQIREALMLTALLTRSQTRTICEHILFVRRVQTMREVFALAKVAGAAFQGGDGSVSPLPPQVDEEALMRPVRRYLAEFVTCVMLGSLSEALAVALCCLMQSVGINITGEIEGRDVGADSRVHIEDLCKRAIEHSLQNGLTLNHMITEAVTHINTLQMLYRQQENFRLLTEATEARNISLTRLQIVATAHSWYHEDVLQETFAGTLPVMHNRTAFMQTLHETRKHLATAHTKFTESLEQQRQLINSVEQRLKWAAGANPALHDVMAAFGGTVQALNLRFERDVLIAKQVGQACGAVLRWEAMRTRTAESLAADENMLKVLQQCKETAGWLSDCREQVSPTEEGLLKLMTPEFANDPKLLLKLVQKITENIDDWKRTLNDSNTKVAEHRANLDRQVERLKKLLADHHALIQEVRHLLKTMARFEDCATAGVAQYLVKYAEFSEIISYLVKLLTATDSLAIIPEQDIDQAIAHLDLLPEKIKVIYDELVSFGDKGRKRPPLVRQESIHGSPKHPPADKGATKGKAVQERNSYAINVWRRIQMKLEGRDPDPGRRSSTIEQVDFIIREATSLDNLALLYEGWTPWV